MLVKNNAYVPCPLCGGVLTGVELQRTKAAGSAPCLADITCFRCRAWLPSFIKEAKLDASKPSLPQEVAGLPLALAPDIAHAATASSWARLSPEQLEEARMADIPMCTAESAVALARSLAAAVPIPAAPVGHAMVAPREDENASTGVSASQPMSRGAMQSAIADCMLDGWDAEE